MERRYSGEFWWLLALTLAQIPLTLVYAGRLPARVASHFGPSGAADAWTGRETLLIGLVLVAFGLFGVFLLSAKIGRWTGDESVNLPNKAYWLAPERRAATMRRIERHILRMGVATQALLLVAFQQAYAANASGAFHLGNGLWIALAIYSIVLIGLLAAMVRDFARPAIG